jgi:hypothetical protein
MGKAAGNADSLSGFRALNLSAWPERRDFQPQAAKVTAAETPPDPAPRGSVSDKLAAGFLTSRVIALRAAFPTFRQWQMVRRLAAYSCGGSHGFGA